MMGSIRRLKVVVVVTIVDATAAAVSSPLLAACEDSDALTDNPFAIPRKLLCVGSPHEREYQQQGIGVALPRPTLGILAKDAEGKEEVRVPHTGSAIALTGTDNNAPAIYSIFIAITLSVCASYFSLSLSLSPPNKTLLRFRV
jgi:hypothetical protein